MTCNVKFINLFIFKKIEDGLFDTFFNALFGETFRFQVRRKSRIAEERSQICFFFFK